MPKTSSERPGREKPQVPTAPEPASASAPEGMERARALARCYLPDAVRLLAGIALAPDSEAALHSRMLAAKTIVGLITRTKTRRDSLLLLFMRQTASSLTLECFRYRISWSP